MTDNRTTELREKLDELGIEHFDYDKGGRTQTMWESPGDMRHFTYETAANPAKTAKLIIGWFPTPEQAIAATLGSDKPPYDELLRCLENDWHIHASWDGLRKFWCIELTEEGVRVRDAELGSELVECGICKFYHADIQLCEYGIPPCSKFERNELNARAERTCRNTHENRWFKCSACGYGFTDLYAEDEGDINEQPRYCPNCGCKVVDA